LIAKCVKLLIAKNDRNSPNGEKPMALTFPSVNMCVYIWAVIISIISHGEIAGMKLIWLDSRCI